MSLLQQHGTRMHAGVYAMCHVHLYIKRICTSTHTHPCKSESVHESHLPWYPILCMQPTNWNEYAMPMRRWPCLGLVFEKPCSSRAHSPPKKKKPCSSFAHSSVPGALTYNRWVSHHETLRLQSCAPFFFGLFVLLRAHLRERVWMNVYVCVCASSWHLCGELCYKLCTIALFACGKSAFNILLIRACYARTCTCVFVCVCVCVCVLCTIALFACGKSALNIQ